MKIIADNIKCSNCGYNGIVEMGENTCVKCGKYGCLAWKENEEKEIEIDEEELNKIYN